MIGSTNAMGYADLDLRPPEMQRSTMYQSTCMCECGNVFESASNGCSRELVESEAYQSCDGIDFNSEKAFMFYRAYMIDRESNPNDLASNFFHILHAAWACDDFDMENARKMRLIGINLLEQIINDEQYEHVKNDNLLMEADLLRRNGKFDLLIEKFNDIKFEDEIYQKIIDFQLKKASQKDDSRYTVGDVIG
ncbi:hypothetical protein [uncultured Methanobrevibacter sp.]|uniref:hypothetical protein n=1 Tax=uncultured Methanobrevibacter sp. TaxID=253161 RepID=UPI0025DB65F6|nr:hypothetical protein [uncultured Methanobrevibacter sp.]